MPRAFRQIARRAGQLQVRAPVRPAQRLRHDVVDVDLVAQPATADRAPAALSLRQNLERSRALRQFAAAFVSPDLVRVGQFPRADQSSRPSRVRRAPRPLPLRRGRPQKPGRLARGGALNLRRSPLSRLSIPGSLLARPKLRVGQTVSRKTRAPAESLSPLSPLFCQSRRVSIPRRALGRVPRCFLNWRASQYFQSPKNSDTPTNPTGFMLLQASSTAKRRNFPAGLAHGRSSGSGGFAVRSMVVLTG